MSGLPGPDTLIKNNDDANYVIAWKRKYSFETGRLDDVMTYAEAKAKAAELTAADKEDKTYWAQHTQANPHRP